MIHRPKTLFASMAIALALSPGLALSSTVLKLSLEDMSARAKTIVHGRITKLSPGQVPSSGLIYTQVTVQVSETWKGQAADTYTFRHIGGVYNGRGLRIAGAARFKVGEEAVLFVDEACAKTGCAFTIGLAQGKFLIERDPASGRKRARRFLGDLDLVDRRRRKTGSAPQGPRVLLLAELRQRVQAAVKKQASR